jgi:hypothetical protein
MLPNNVTEKGCRQSIYRGLSAGLSWESQIGSLAFGRPALNQREIAPNENCMNGR